MFNIEIIRAPENTTVFLDKTSVLTCETDGGLTGWRINGTLLTDQLDLRSDLVISETNTNERTTVQNLTIPARAEYNGTKFQCVVLGFDGFAESENATLMIQGIQILCCRIMIFKKLFC